MPIRGPGADRGVVFQRHALMPWLNVAENVAFGPRMRGVPRTERRRIALAMLDLVGLAGFADRNLGAVCRRIRDDFNRYLVKDGIVAGLVDFHADGVEYLLHPRDGKTGIHYRLLPMTRGILSGMFTPEQVRDHRPHKEHRLFPDGADLMDRPMKYHGGTEQPFRRAETSAYFGREIGLQYVHAHNRLAEAMAKLGQPDEAYDALLKIIPIGIQDIVPTAERRQRNAYLVAPTPPSATATTPSITSTKSNHCRSESRADGASTPAGPAWWSPRSS